MNFVNADGRAQGVPPASLRQPFLIGPLELAIVPDDGGVLGRHLKKETIGTSFKDNLSLRIPDFKLVMRPLANTRSKYLPDT